MQDVMDEREHLSPPTVTAILVRAVVLGGPAIAMVELQVGPGRWLVGFQNRLLGMHFPVSSMAALMLGEILALAVILVPIGVIVRKVTGKTIVSARPHEPA
jgi:hypothetical protein